MKQLCLALAFYLFVGVSGTAFSKTVYDVRATGCPSGPVTRTLTGFELRGIEGVITALHGVVGCKISVSDGVHDSIGMTIIKVDVANDVALLSAPGLTGIGGFPQAELAPNVGDKLTVIGHPLGISQHKKSVHTGDPALKKLSDLIPSDIFNDMKERASPALENNVLNIEGHVLPGHSGAPVVNENNHVVAIANGGLIGGAAGISWAIPIQYISWAKPKTSDLDRLEQSNVSVLFSFNRSGMLDDIEEGMVLLDGDVQFVMGCDDPRICPSESQPAHAVSITSFMMSKTELTFAHYDTFCEMTGREKPDDNGWGRGNRPVINVSWHDVNDFITWLNSQSRYTYRLPTEAEWEYAARAGSKTAFFWGDTSSPKYANGDNTYSWPEDGVSSGTSEVGRYSANDFGLYDVSGNVAEWVQDCWHPDYAGAPASGSAPWLESNQGNCTSHVHRGGGHFGPAATLELFYRAWKSADFTSSYIGFRLVRPAR